MVGLVDVVITMLVRCIHDIEPGSGVSVFFAHQVRKEDNNIWPSQAQVGSRISSGRPERNSRRNSILSWMDDYAGNAECNNIDPSLPVHTGEALSKESSRNSKDNVMGREEGCGEGSSSSIAIGVNVMEVSNQYKGDQLSSPRSSSSGEEQPPRKSLMELAILEIKKAQEEPTSSLVNSDNGAGVCFY